MKFVDKDTSVEVEVEVPRVNKTIHIMNATSAIIAVMRIITKRKGYFLIIFTYFEE